jgi:hypothetical protein
LLADNERISGVEDLDRLTTGHNLGRAYLDDGRLDDAIATYETLRANRARTLGPNTPTRSGPSTTSRVLTEPLHTTSVLGQVVGREQLREDLRVDFVGLDLRLSDRPCLLRVC